MRAGNPFRPGAGLVPAQLAGRDAQERAFRSMLASAPETPASLRLTGPRGVGKTVLLESLGAVAADAGWSSVLVGLSPRHDSEDALSRLLDGHLDRLGAQLARARKARAALGVVEVARPAATGPDEGSWTPGADLDPRAASFAASLADVLATAGRAGRAGVVLLLDDAHVLADERKRDGDRALSMLLTAVGSLWRRRLPLALVLCGGPTLETNLRAVGDVAWPSRGVDVGWLTDEQARDAVTSPLDGSGRTAEPDLVDRVVARAGGCPFLLQFWGAELWDAATDAGVEVLSVRLLESVEDEILRLADLDVYDSWVGSLTPAEQDLLRDAAGCSYPPLRAGELAVRSTRSVGNVNVLLVRLAKAEVLERRGKGRYVYPVPGFDDYLRRRAGLGERRPR